MEAQNKIVIVISRGLDDERSSVAQLNPLDPPIGEMIQNVLSQGASILVCPPCARVRGYEGEHLIDGITLAGAPAMLERVQQGAATLSF